MAENLPTPLADRLFLVALDDRSGTPQVEHAVLSLALAAGLLAELLVSGHITIHQRYPVVIRTGPPVDELSHQILNQMYGEQRQRRNARQEPLELPSWLGYLAHDAVDQVSRRLERANWIARERRGVLRRHLVWLPTDPVAVARIGAGLRHQLQTRAPLTPRDATLAGLVDVAGLNGHVIWAATPQTSRYQQRVIGSLPGELRGLLAGTRAAIDDAVLAPFG